MCCPILAVYHPSGPCRLYSMVPELFDGNSLTVVRDYGWSGHVCEGAPCGCTPSTTCSSNPETE